MPLLIPYKVSACVRRVSPHCLFILPADVISSCCCGTLTCHLPPSVAAAQSVSVHTVRENTPVFISAGPLPLPHSSQPPPTSRKVTEAPRCKNLFVHKCQFSFGSLIATLTFSCPSPCLTCSRVTFFGPCTLNSPDPRLSFPAISPLFDWNTLGWQGTPSVPNGQTMLRWPKGFSVRPPPSFIVGSVTRITLSRDPVITLSVFPWMCLIIYLYLMIKCTCVSRLLKHERLQWFREQSWFTAMQHVGFIQVAGVCFV